MVAEGGGGEAGLVAEAGAVEAGPLAEAGADKVGPLAEAGADEAGLVAEAGASKRATSPKVACSKRGRQGPGEPLASRGAASRMLLSRALPTSTPRASRVPSAVSRLSSSSSRGGSRSSRCARHAPAASLAPRQFGWGHGSQAGVVCWMQRWMPLASSAHDGAARADAALPGQQHQDERGVCTTRWRCRGRRHGRPRQGSTACQ
jgi:hypothetical protein